MKLSVRYANHKLFSHLSQPKNWLFIALIRDVTVKVLHSFPQRCRSLKEGSEMKAANVGGFVIVDENPGVNHLFLSFHSTQHSSNAKDWRFKGIVHPNMNVMSLFTIMPICSI